MHRIVVAALIVMMLAGCAGQEAESVHLDDVAQSDGRKVDFVDEDDLEVDVEEKEPTDKDVYVDPELYVTVVEPGQHPLEGALVSVLGTQFAAWSDSNGTVHFGNITVGRYTLRITPAQEWYNVLEANVTVTDKAITRVTAVVQIADGLLTPPHTHGDAWVHGDRIELFSRTFDDFHCAFLQSYCYDTSGRNQYKSWQFDEVVPPGTGSIDITMEWGSPTDTPFYLDVWGLRKSYPNLYFENSGDTVTIEVPPEDADPAHATVSAWKYQWSPDIMGLQFGTWTAPFIITVEAIRGDFNLTLDPPHPDYWGERTRIRMTEYTEAADPLEVYLLTTGVNSDNPRVFDDGALVYPGADRLEFRAWINHTVTPYDPDMVLWYRSNEESPWSRMSASTQDGFSYAWDVPVTHFDPIYQSRSSWQYKIHLPSLAPQAQGNYPLPLAYSGGEEVHVIVTAVKQGS